MLEIRMLSPNSKTAGQGAGTTWMRSKGGAPSPSLFLFQLARDFLS